MRRFAFVLFFSVFMVTDATTTFPGLTRELVFPRRQLLQHGRRRLQGTHITGEALSSDFRRLLNQASDCEWQSSTKDCVVSADATMKFLKESDSEVAKVFLEELECQIKSKKGSCNKEQGCLWTDDDKTCSFLDLSANHNKSPCRKAAPLFFDVLKGITMCPKIQDRKECSKNKKCDWSNNSGCAIDFFFVMFHIKSYIEKTSTVASTMSQEKSQAMMLDPLFSKPGFTWDSVLDWKPPVTVCPSHVDKTICKIVEAYLDVYLPVMMYCQGKHDSYSGCTDDPLCAVTPVGTCAPSRSVDHKADATTTKILLELLKDGPDKQYASSVLTCSQIATQHDCKGYCTWDSVEASCGINVISLFKSIVSAGGDHTEDGLCGFLDIAASKGCEEESEKKHCQKMDACVWDDIDGCITTSEAIIEAALESSPKAAKQYTKASKKCAEHQSRKQCAQSLLWADVLPTYAY